MAESYRKTFHFTENDVIEQLDSHFSAYLCREESNFKNELNKIEQKQSFPRLPHRLNRMQCFRSALHACGRFRM